VGQEPLYYNALNTGRPAASMDLSHPARDSAQKYVSRYIDEVNAPLYPFGYGLSYTSFQYSPVTLSTQSLSADALNLDLNQNKGTKADKALLRVSAEVKNTGSRTGSEVVQLYIRQQGTSVTRPVRELKGFQKVTLAPGESKRIEFTLGGEDLKFWNIDMKEIVEPASLTVWIAPNSSEGSEGKVTIH